MTITSKFAGTCKRCGGRFEAGARVEWARGRGAEHATNAECVAARAAAATDAEARRAAAPTVEPGSHLALATFLRAAQSRGLRFPKARFLANGQEIRLSLAGERSQAPGAVNVVRESDREWLGRIEADGRVIGRRLAGDQPLLSTLLRIAENPAEAAREYGRMMARCAFCNANLTDDRTGASVEMGYGKTCANKWGLPWTPTGARRELAAVGGAR